MFRYPARKRRRTVLPCHLLDGPAPQQQVDAPPEEIIELRSLQDGPRQIFLDPVHTGAAVYELDTTVLEAGDHICEIILGVVRAILQDDDFRVKETAKIVIPSHLLREPPGGVSQVDHAVAPPQIADQPPRVLLTVVDPHTERVRVTENHDVRLVPMPLQLYRLAPVAVLIDRIMKRVLAGNRVDHSRVCKNQTPVLRRVLVAWGDIFHRAEPA